MVGASLGRSRAGAGVDYGGADDLLRCGLHVAKPRTDLAGSIAGNGNRTRMASLEGWNFTIKLCPRGIKLPRRGSNANSFFGKSLNHCQFFSAPCCFEPECTRGKTQFVRSRGPGLSGHLFVERGRDKCGVVAAETK